MSKTDRRTSSSSKDSHSDKPEEKRAPFQNEPPAARQQWLLFLWLTLGIFLTFNYFDATEQQGQVELTYSEFLDAVEAGHIEEVTLHGQDVEGSFSDAGREAREAEDVETFETICLCTGQPNGWPGLNSRGLTLLYGLSCYHA